MAEESAVERVRVDMRVKARVRGKARVRDGCEGEGEGDLREKVSRTGVGRANEFGVEGKELAPKQM